MREQSSRDAFDAANNSSDASNAAEIPRPTQAAQQQAPPPLAASTADSSGDEFAATLVGKSHLQIYETMRTCSLDEFRSLIRSIEAQGRTIDCEDINDDHSLKDLRRRMLEDMARDLGIGTGQSARQGRAAAPGQHVENDGADAGGFMLGMLREETGKFERMSVEEAREYFMMEAVAKAFEYCRDAREVMRRFQGLSDAEVERLRREKVGELRDSATDWRRG